MEVRKHWDAKKSATNKKENAKLLNENPVSSKSIPQKDVK